MVEKDLNVRIRTAIDQFSKRRVHRQLMLASTPDAAKKIAQKLPGVDDLVVIGPDAVPAVLELLKQESPNDNQIVTIALYLLWKIPAAETTDTLARHIVAGDFTGINAELGAELYLDRLGIDVEKEDRVTAALREAKSRLNKDSSPKQQ